MMSEILLSVGDFQFSKKGERKKEIQLVSIVVPGGLEARGDDLNAEVKASEIWKNVTPSSPPSMAGLGYTFYKGDPGQGISLALQVWEIDEGEKRALPTILNGLIEIPRILTGITKTSEILGTDVVTGALNKITSEFSKNDLLYTFRYTGLKPQEGFNGQFPWVGDYPFGNDYLAGTFRLRELG